MKISTMGAHALDLAHRGFRVGPLHTPDPDHPCGCSCWRDKCESEGKHPRIPSPGVHDFTTDPVSIQRWWRMWPEANVGVACGDGLVVLDVDPRHGGDDSLMELEEEHGEIITLTTRTGGGGLHLYLAGDLPTRNPFRPGLDLKASGGYVVAPPSLHGSGRRYEWVDPGEGIRVAPQWLVEMVRPKKVGSRLPGSARAGAGLPDDLDDLLRAIPASCGHAEWLRVGMALHHADPAAGFEPWNQWSATCPEKYPGREELRRRWESFDTDRSPVVTVGSLRHIAATRAAA